MSSITLVHHKKATNRLLYYQRRARLRPIELALVFPRNLAGHVVEGTCLGPANPRGSLKMGSHIVCGVGEEEGYRKAAWSMLMVRATTQGARLSEHSLF